MLECVTIMAGGIGSRLWPASNRHCPKQFLPLGFEGESLLVRTIRRALALQPQAILLVSPQEQLQLLCEQCAKFSLEEQQLLHLLIEPEGRNTAAALALAARWVEKYLGAKARQLVLPADHLITDVQKFSADVALASELANDYLVVFGIKPSCPETGYGYIQKGEARATAFAVAKFIEKPDYSQAVALLERGNCFWNSGMFCYATQLFLDELQLHNSSILAALECIQLQVSVANNYHLYLPSDSLYADYHKLPQLSIDYALMERSKRLVMLKANFDWNDVGSWDAMADLDQDGSLSISNQGLLSEVEAKNNYVRTKMPVAICGLDDLIVIEANDSLLICRRGSTQLVKKINL